MEDGRQKGESQRPSSATQKNYTPLVMSFLQWADTHVCSKLTSTVRVMKIWIEAFVEDFCNFLYSSSLNVVQELLQTGLRGAGEERQGCESGDKYCAAAMLRMNEEKYLCAEFGESFFIQVGLFINSGFIPKLRTRRRYILRTVLHTATLY